MHVEPYYVPGLLSVDDDRVVQVIQRVEEGALPSAGLATFYLATASMREANQCLLASTILMLAMRTYGVPVELVAVELSIPWGDGGRGVHYGRADPILNDVALRGHIGLLTDERFIDATAYQFPEIRRVMGTALPILAAMGAENASRSATAGATLGIKLIDGQQVNYRIHPVGSAAQVTLQFLEMQPDRQELVRQAEHLVLSYAAFVQAVRPGAQTRFPRFNKALEKAQQRAPKAAVREFRD